MTGEDAVTFDAAAAVRQRSDTARPRSVRF
jgi:hypothetical protein